MANKSDVGTLITEEHKLGTLVLDLFSKPPIESTQILGQMQTIYMLSTINDTGPYEFIVSNDSHEFIHLEHTTLYGEVEVHTSAGAAIADADIVTVVNNFPQTLFRQVELYLNNVCVSDISTPTYAYKTYMENHFTYQKSLKETTLMAKELYIADTAGTDLGKDVEANLKDDNSGFKK